MIGIILFYVLSGANAPTGSSKMLEAARDALPDGVVTLEFVLSRALEASDSFRSVAADAARVTTPTLQALSVYDPRVYVSSMIVDSDLEPAISFQPLGSQGWESTASLSVNLPTGTELKVSGYHERKDLRFSSSPPASYHFSQGEIQFSQNLLKDALGIGGRAQVRSGRALSESLRWRVLASAERWWLQFAELFYRAWIAQREVSAGQDSLARRQEIRNITAKRTERGTSVSTDLLQVESAVLASEAQLASRQNQLRDIWRALVIALYLPEEFLAVDPTEIPMKLDDLRAEAERKCQDVSDQELLRGQSNVLAAEAMAVAASESLLSKKWNTPFDLEAFGTLSASNSEPKGSDSLTDTLTGKNSGWSLGLRLNAPLFDWSHRAAYAEAKAESIKMSQEAALARSTSVVEFRNRCDLLKVQQKAQRDFARVVAKQTTREGQMRRRFKIGDTSAFEVVQAGDDMTQAETSLSQIEAESRLTAWRILASTGFLRDKLHEAIVSKEGRR